MQRNSFCFFVVRCQISQITQPACVLSTHSQFSRHVCLLRAAGRVTSRAHVLPPAHLIALVESNLLRFNIILIGSFAEKVPHITTSFRQNDWFPNRKKFAVVSCGIGWESCGSGLLRILFWFNLAMPVRIRSRHFTYTILGKIRRSLHSRSTCF